MTTWGDSDTLRISFKTSYGVDCEGIWFVLTVATVRSHWRGTWKGLNNYLEIGN